MEPTAPQSFHMRMNANDNQDSIKQSRSSKLFQQPGVWIAPDDNTSENRDSTFIAYPAKEREIAVTEETHAVENIETRKVPSQKLHLNNAQRIEEIQAIETQKIPVPVQQPLFPNLPPAVLAYNTPNYEPAHASETSQTWFRSAYPQPFNTFTPGPSPAFSNVSFSAGMTRGKAAILVALLLIVVLQAINIGPTQFLGAQGWAAVLAGSSNNQRTSFFNSLAQSKAAKDAKDKGAADPQRAVDTIIGQMSLDQKLGQMMMVQFVGADYSLQLSTMISQYNIGSVLLFYANGNIVGKEQVKSLTQQIQQGSTTLPIAISIDQEGGTVDRLVQLDGPRPSEASIGATNDPEKARQAGLQDAQDLTSYGINLNLAPVVDVDNLVTSEMHQDNRTYGGNPAIVSSMAGAYLEGLQQSGKVVGTLKHFPGLGYVNVDPHFGIPRLNRTKDEMEQIDWSPYRTLIQQGQVHTIMVTHEIVPAIDGTRPSSLSPQLVQGILRDEMHFQGVIMTDSLTMAGITEYYTPGQAAALAVEAGSDMIMGANSPTELATMLDGIKQAVSDGTISKARIDESVRRILMMKYQMGLLSTPKN